MNKEKKLLIERTIFTFFIMTAFAIIIITEKKEEILSPKIQKNFTEYIENNYKEIKNETELEDIKMKGKTFQAKVVSKENKNHFFYLFYSNHTTKDTFQKDYVEGNSLLTHIQSKLKQEIKQKTNIEYDVEINTSLNQFTNIVREKIIKEDNLIQLKIFTLNKEIEISNWGAKEITQEISSLLEKNKKNNITPKNINIIINNKQDITQSIKIENLTENFINNNEKEQIINDIINDNNSLLLKQNKITYQYLN